MVKKIEFLQSTNKDLAKYATDINIVNSSGALGWDGIIVEEGSATLFCPNDVVTNGHYFAMLLSNEYDWEAIYKGKFNKLHTYKNQIWINPKDESFTHRVNMYNEFGLVLLSDEQLRAAIGGHTDLRNIVFEPKYNADDIQLQNLINILLTEIRYGNPNQQIFVESITNALALHYLNHYSNFRLILESKQGKIKLRRIILFIREHLETGLSLRFICQQFNLSQTTLINSFKQELNTTPHLFIQNEKLVQAARLLRQTNLAISEVAFKFGFSDQSHFSRLFKARFGVTPLNYREHQWVDYSQIKYDL